MRVVVRSICGTHTSRTVGANVAAPPQRLTHVTAAHDASVHTLPRSMADRSDVLGGAERR